MGSEGKSDRLDETPLRAQRLFQRGHGAIEILLVAAVLYARAGVANAGAITRESASTGRKARAESDMIEIDREMARIGDIGAPAARAEKSLWRDATGRGNGGEAERR
ncbi:hypothetical protein MSC49_03460 [Methylosinus sp. C49]|jgi:hypothetical protein|nr:hypothetical protein MSC49_03460 [Methylosinus sp. C49]